MEKEFIKYEQALALKDLGFDEPCLAYYLCSFLKDNFQIKYGITNENLLKYDKDNKHRVSAPLYQQGFRWFREKYNFDLNWKPMSMVGITCYYDIEIHHPKYVWDTPPKVTGKTYEEAEFECLKKLIEIVKR